jgi:S1-C subfamily serine protease
MLKCKLLIVMMISAALVVTACGTSATATSAPPTATNASDAPTTGEPLGGGPLMSGFPDIASVVEAINPAVVQIIATVEQRNVFGQVTETRSQGSGVFFSKEGYLITNNHVVEGATSVEIALSNRQRVPVEVVGTDPVTDLAVLKMDPAEVDELTIAVLGDTDAMRIGDWVIAIGSPLGFEGSVTVGVISAKGRSLTVDQNSPSLNDLIQTDAVINPGNSGGPLLNLAGEVIGINTAIIRGAIGNNQEAEGIGFSISMGTAIPVTQQLIENGRVIRPRIGVGVADVIPTLSAERGLTVDEGVLILSLAPGGPGEAAGLEVNDVIVRVGEFAVTSTTELVRLLLNSYRVGDTVKVTIIRSAVTLSFDVVLAEVP